MFMLGNYNVDEVLFGVAEDFQGNLLYTVDQLTGATIEVSSESTDYTDKRGNIVRTVYRNKTATFNATSAFLHPLIQNIGSGSDIEYASDDAKIQMPKIVTVAAGGNFTVEADAITDSIQVIGLYANGANGKVLKADTNASYEAGKFGLAGKVITVPTTGDDLPVTYLIKYDRQVSAGMAMTNRSDKFPSTVRFTLFCSIMDPCKEELRAAYVYIPSFTADPNMTLSLDSETQEVDFNGNINTAYCGADSKVLYRVFFPGDEVVSTAVGA